MKKISLAFLSKIVLAVVFVICIAITVSTVLYLAANRDYQKMRTLESTKETTDWNVYKSEEYGFEIKYPNNVSSPDISNAEDNDKEKIQQRVDFQISDKSKISILVWNKSVAKNSDEKYGKIIVNKKVVLQNKKNPLKNYIYHKTYILQIEYFGDQKEENAELYNNMLSTLKLAD